MENKNLIIEKTLESINSIEKASPKPFLLTKVNAAIAASKANATIWSFIAFYLKKPIVATTAILLLLFINIIVITKTGNTEERDNITKSISLPKYDFAINVSVMYDTENQEP